MRCRGPCAKAKSSRRARLRHDLRQAGYTDDKDGESTLGTFHLVKGGIDITPGAESYHSPEPARISIEDGQVSHITSQGTELSAYELEPQLVTALFDAEQRSKRELVKYNEIPPDDGAGGAGDRGPALLRA